MRRLRDIFNLIKLPLQVAVVTAVVMQAITFGLIANENNDIEKTETTRSVVFLQHLLTHLQLVTLQGSAGTNAIALKVESNSGKFSGPEDQSFADGIMRTMPDWHNVSISPSDCIRLVSPIEGNRSALGYCLYSSANEWKDISLIVKANRVRILGPYVLAQGGVGYIMHRPIYLENGKYWGLVSAVILKDQFIAPLIEAGKSDGMNFTVSISDVDDLDPRTMYNDVKADAKFLVSKKFKLGDNLFSVAAAPKVIDYTNLENLERRMGVVTVSIIFTNVLITTLVRRQREATKKWLEISKYSPSVLFQLHVSREGKLDLDYVSTNCLNLFGMDAETLQSAENPLALIFEADDVNRAITRLKAVKSPGEVWSQRMALLSPHKGQTWIQVDATYERIANGQHSWNGVFVDATSAVDKEATNLLTAKAFDILEEGVVVMDSEWNIVNANKATISLTGYSLAALVGRNIDDFVGGLNDADFTQQLKEGLAARGIWRGQTYFRNNDGTINRDFVTFTAIKNNAGDIVEIIAVINGTQDILIDATTSLANRKLFEENLTASVDVAEVTNHKVALFHIGVHGVGAINDTFGYLIGDRVMREVAEKLLPFASTSRSVGRLRDSEFGLYRELVSEGEDLDSLAKSILETLAEPLEYDKIKVLLDVSIGIAVYPDDSNGMQELRSHADQAYKTTLASSENKISYFSNEYEERAKVRSYLTSYLNEALENKSLQFFYQPIVKVSDRSFVKAEVLTRWFDEHLGEVSPARFIPIAEKSSLINQLGLQLLESTLKFSEELSKSGKEVQLSVNVSPYEFMGENFVRERNALFEKYPLAKRENIVFELTEGSLLSNKNLVQKRIEDFSKQGIGFAIDDFGTGYSSLSYLQELRVDYVKIDKSFVDRIETESGLALCKAIVDLAHAISLQVIAEGVESESQLALLNSIGCDYAQGYLFSKPVNQKAFVKLLS